MAITRRDAFLSSWLQVEALPSPQPSPLESVVVPEMPSLPNLIPASRKREPGWEAPVRVPRTLSRRTACRKMSDYLREVTLGDVETLSKEIEAELFKLHTYKESRPYKAALRSVCSNLKRSSALRRAVASDKFRPLELCRLPKAKLASYASDPPQQVAPLPSSTAGMSAAMAISRPPPTACPFIAQITSFGVCSKRFTITI